MDLILKFGTAFGGGAIAYLFGGWSGSLGVLLTLVAIDYITGCMASGLEEVKGTGQGLKSRVGLTGIARKVTN